MHEAGQCVCLLQSLSCLQGSGHRSDKKAHFRATLGSASQPSERSRDSGAVTWWDEQVRLAMRSP